MNVIGIIKDAFLFPSKKTGRFAIYLLLAVFLSLFALGGFLTYILGILDAENYLIGGIYCIIAMLIGFLIFGYHINVIKSGIELSDEIPVFHLFEDFTTGFDGFVVFMFYFIIPTLIVGVVGLDTNIYGNAIAIVREVISQMFNVLVMGNSPDVAASAISHTISTFMTSLSITITAALVLFTIFSVIQSIAQARLANTGSVIEALNIFESLKDIKRIGVGKVIILILLINLVSAIIEFALVIILSSFPFLLMTIFIIITPYFALVIQRAIGLLYSDIA